MQPSAVAVGLVVLGLTAVASAQSADKAKVVDAFGTSQRRIGTAAKWEPVNVGDLLAPATWLKTGANSAVLLALPDKHVMRVGANTTVELKALGKDKAYSFNVAAGKVWSIVNSASKPAKYEIETPSAVAGVQGTLFGVFHDATDDATNVSAAEGQVEVRQGGKKWMVKQGSCTNLKRGMKQDAVVMDQPEHIRVMWKLLREREGWMRGGGEKLDRERVERGLQDFDQRHRAAMMEFWKRRQAAAAKAGQRPGPPRGPGKPNGRR